MFNKVISIRQKFTVSMTYILLFELVIYAIFVFFGGTLGLVVSNVYNTLTETSAIRAQNLEGSMYSVSEIAENSYNTINEVMAKEAAKTTSDYDEAFYSIYSDLLNVASKQNITGSFVVMGTDLTADRLPAIYIRKSSKAYSSQLFSLKISPESLISKTGLDKNLHWSNSLNMKEQSGLDFLI